MRIRLLAAALVATATVAACAPTEPAPVTQATPPGAALYGVEWQIVSINGQAIVPDSKPTISFEEGRVFGAGSCNRFMGGYELGDTFTIKLSQMASTMMACPEPLMAQEGQLLETLSDVTSYSIDTSGNLVLTAPDNRSIVAKRP